MDLRLLPWDLWRVVCSTSVDHTQIVGSQAKGRTSLFLLLHVDWGLAASTTSALWRWPLKLHPTTPLCETLSSFPRSYASKVSTDLVKNCYFISKRSLTRKVHTQKHEKQRTFCLYMPASIHRQSKWVKDNGKDRVLKSIGAKLLVFAEDRKCTIHHFVEFVVLFCSLCIHHGKE